MQSVWQFSSKLVGGLPLRKGPTDSRWGSVERTGGVSVGPVGSLCASPFWPLWLNIFSSMDRGGLFPPSSALSSSWVASCRRKRTRKTPAMKDRIAAETVDSTSVASQDQIIATHLQRRGQQEHLPALPQQLAEFLRLYVRLGRGLPYPKSEPPLRQKR